jgi:hypothetical protein
VDGEGEVRNESRRVPFPEPHSRIRNGPRGKLSCAHFRIFLTEDSPNLLGSALRTTSNGCGLPHFAFVPYVLLHVRSHNIESMVYSQALTLNTRTSRLDQSASDISVHLAGSLVHLVPVGLCAELRGRQLLVLRGHS